MWLFTVVCLLVETEDVLRELGELDGHDVETRVLLWNEWLEGDNSVYFPATSMTVTKTGMCLTASHVHYVGRRGPVRRA